MTNIFFFTLLIEKSPQALPLGAGCVASSCKNDPRLKDCNVILKSISVEDENYIAARKCGKETDFLLDYIIGKTSPDFLGLSVYVWNHNELIQLASLAKQKFPNCKIIFGGPEATANPDAFKEFDFVCLGEGEFSNTDYIAKVLGKTERTENNIENRLSLLKSPYLDGTIDPSEFGGVLWELARGCPFKCSYCYESKGSSTISFFPMERIEEELKLFARKKIPQVFVLDPTYNADKKRALKILKLIKKYTPKTFYYFEARAEFIDREMAKAFTQIPCALQFGLQSSDENVLKLVHRGLNKKTFERNIGYLNETGVIFGFDLIYGLPGDTITGFKNSIDFAISLYPNNLETFCLSVLPGTVLFDDAEKLNLTFERTPPYHVIKTSLYSEKDLELSSKISSSINLFYNDGRAVPYFNSILHLLHTKASVFFEDFADFIEKTEHKTTVDFYRENPTYDEIEKRMINFVQEKIERKFSASPLSKKICTVADNIIRLNGALSGTTADGKKRTVKLSYHSEDLMSEYSQDILFFAKNCRQMNYTASTFMTPDGVDYK